LRKQTWRKALIDASGLKPRNFEADHDL
jgi:hypothetical protein